ncbi:MAG: hypothetical protein ACLUDU_07060 [Butyricimonas faecihominis]
MVKVLIGIILVFLHRLKRNNNVFHWAVEQQTVVDIFKLLNSRSLTNSYHDADILKLGKRI